jgi:hypothetical protein
MLEDQLPIMYSGPRLIIFLSPLWPISQVIHVVLFQEYHDSWLFELKIYLNIITTHYFLHLHSHQHRRYSLVGMSMYQTWRMSWLARITSGLRYWEAVEWGRLQQRSTSYIIQRSRRDMAKYGTLWAATRLLPVAHSHYSFYRSFSTK